MDEENMAAEAAQELDVEALWDESGVQEDATPTQETEAEREEPAGEAEESAPGESGGEESQPGQEEQSPELERFELKHLGQVQTVGREDVIRLAQQGMDYDRVRTERDQLRAFRSQADPALQLVRQYAERNGLSVEEYIDFCRKQELMSGGVNEATAEAQIKLEKREAAVAAQEAQTSAQTQRENALREQAQAKAEARRRDMEAFIRAYPEVKGGDIPREVWQRVQAGESLVSAYTMYQNQQLKAQLAAREQNKSNAARTPGSMSTRGDNGRKTISDYWDEAEG